MNIPENIDLMKNPEIVLRLNQVIDEFARIQNKLLGPAQNTSEAEQQANQRFYAKVQEVNNDCKKLNSKTP
jgi:hypothetical protein